MSKDRDIEVLQRKIAELEAKIENYKKNDISNKKIDNLKIQKLEYEDKLSELEYA